jgi:arylsulfatase A-like enzyme
MLGRLSFFGVMVVPGSFVAGESKRPSVAPPNIVFILADDLGWSDLACYGSDLHQTPHLDRLATQGTRFLNAYSASPVCTPTRASILTGRHPARLKMTIWREAAEVRGKRELLEPVVRDQLPLSETTLAEILHQVGYYTAHIGKWHLGRAGAYPQSHGFDVNIGGTLWGAPDSFFYPFRGATYFRSWRYVPDLEPGQPGDYLTDRLTDKAIEIIKRMDGRPFYLNLWYHSVHTPIQGKPALVEKYKGKVQADARHNNPDYAAMVESLDENVGRILDAIDDAKITDRTIVVFFSDNGGFVNQCKLQPDRAVTNNSPLRSGKGSLYEGGIRVPLIVRLPGSDPIGRTCHIPVTSNDLLPTLLALTGFAKNSKGLTLDGVDFSSLLIEDDTPWERETLYFHYPHYYSTTTPVSAIRHKNWKLLEYYEKRPVELYNLERDSGEKHNIATRSPEIVELLRDKLHDWQTEIEVPIPEPNPRWQPRR